MKTTVTFIAPLVAAVALGGALFFAPIAAADTNPLVSYGTDPHSRYVFGYHVSNHDEANTSTGQRDVPF